MFVGQFFLENNTFPPNFLVTHINFSAVCPHTVSTGALTNIIIMMIRIFNVHGWGGTVKFQFWVGDSEVSNEYSSTQGR